MLETRDLTKHFGALTVTDKVSLRLEKGERRVVLGPNGAGKTTLFNMLVGELRPDSGEIRLAGRDVTGLSVDARARMGLARSYQRNNLFQELSIGENLALAAATAAGHSGSMSRDSFMAQDVREIVAEVSSLVGLADQLDAPVDGVSYGARRQLEVGLALATRPKVLLMDEPTSGLGSGMITAFQKLLASFSRELTILVIEHDMDLAFAIADRVTVLDHGEVVFEGEPAEARASRHLAEIYLGSWSADART